MCHCIFAVYLSIEQSVTNPSLSVALQFRLEEDPNYNKVLEEEVASECTNFGPVVFVFVDVNSSDGHVYVKFANEESAVKAHNKMNGRWFAAKQLTSEYLSDASFRAKTGYVPK